MIKLYKLKHLILLINIEEWILPHALIIDTMNKKFILIVKYVHRKYISVMYNINKKIINNNKKLIKFSLSHRKC